MFVSCTLESFEINSLTLLQIYKHWSGLGCFRCCTITYSWNYIIPILSQNTRQQNETVEIFKKNILFPERKSSSKTAWRSDNIAFPWRRSECFHFTKQQSFRCISIILIIRRFASNLMGLFWRARLHKTGRITNRRRSVHQKSIQPTSKRFVAI